MKTQRRHELQTNTLADMIGHYLQENGQQVKFITVSLLALIAVGFAYLFITNQKSANAGSSWIEFYAAAQTADDGTAMEIAAENLKSDNAAGLWARQSLGDIKLSSGSAALYRDREQAETSLKEAEAHYEAVLGGLKNLSNAASKSALKQRANYGLAQVYESLGEPKSAKEKYEEVSNAAPGSVLGKAAAKQAKRVASLHDQEWYAWFQDQEPATAADLNLPEDLELLPDRPDLNFPGRYPVDPIDPPENAGTPKAGPAVPGEPKAVEPEGAASKKGDSKTDDEEKAAAPAAEKAGDPGDGQ